MTSRFKSNSQSPSPHDPSRVDPLIWTLVKAVISAAALAAVAEVSGRFPRRVALLLTLPLVSILAFILLWTRQGKMTASTQLARETQVLMPLGWPFFFPFRLLRRFK